MQIWLDTIDLKVISEAISLKILSGVTTNPSILSHTSSIRKTLLEILALYSGPLAIQVTADRAKEMIEEGKKIYSFSKRAIVKVPITREGLIAISHLIAEGVPVMGTAIIEASQAFLAASYGAAYIAPYFSHLEDPYVILKKIVDILQVNHSSTKILAASVKKVEDLLFCASLGIDSITIKADLFYKLLEKNPKVESFSEKFRSDWEKTHGKLSIKEALDQITPASGSLRRPE